MSTGTLPVAAVRDVFRLDVDDEDAANSCMLLGCGETAVRFCRHVVTVE